MRITFIRHAITDWNATGRWQGHSDTPISEAGMRQAHLLGKRLERHRFDAVYCSPLARARQTLACALPGVQASLDERLKEIDFGEFEGKTFEENAGHPAFPGWLENPYTTPAPGGESLETVVRRMVGWLETLPPEGEREQHILVVSHSCAIRALLSHLMRLPMVINDGHHFPFVIQTPHTSLSRVRHCHGFWTLEQLGDVGHLDVGG